MSRRRAEGKRFEEEEEAVVGMMVGGFVNQRGERALGSTGGEGWCCCCWVLDSRAKLVLLLLPLGGDEFRPVVASLSRFSSSARRACNAATSLAVGADGESL